MGPGTTIAKRTSSMKTDTTAVPVEIPQDIIEETLSHLGSSEGEAASRFALLSCSLVSKSWVAPCRRYLFRMITLSEKYMKNWIETFPVPEKSPAHYAKKLRFWYTWPSGTPEGLFGYIPWFKNVREVAWGGHVGLQQLCRILSLGNLSQSVVSLCIDMDLVAASQIRDVIEMLPNLYDLGLLGSFAAMGTNGSRGIGAAPKRKFGGQLELHGEYADADIINMLLEVPTGLHFTGVLICSPEACLLSAVRLAEACGENLTKLTYIVEDHDDGGRSFNFQKFPNLREGTFTARWTYTGLRWIHEALSTVKPTTSPRLTELQFNDYLLSPPTPHGQVTNNPKLIDEVSRIEREFMGAVNPSVGTF